MVGAGKVEEVLDGISDIPPELKKIELEDASDENFSCLLREISKAANALSVINGVDIVDGVNIEPIMKQAEEINPKIREYFSLTDLEKGDFNTFAILQDILNVKVFMPANRLFIVLSASEDDNGGSLPRQTYEAEILNWRQESYPIWIADIKWKKTPPASLAFTIAQYAFVDPIRIKEAYSGTYDEGPYDPLDGLVKEYIHPKIMDKDTFTDSWHGRIGYCQISAAKNSMHTSLISKKPIVQISKEEYVKTICTPRTLNKPLDYQNIIETTGLLGGIIAEMEFYIDKKQPDMAYLAFLSFFNDIYFHDVYVKSRLSLKKKGKEDVLEASLEKRGIDSREKFLRCVKKHPKKKPDARANKALKLLKEIYEENFWPDEKRSTFLKRRRICTQLTPSAIVDAIFEGGDNRLLAEILISLQGKFDAQRRLLEDVLIEFESRIDITNLNIDYMMNAVITAFEDESLKEVHFSSMEDLDEHRRRLDKLKFLPAELEKKYKHWSKKTFVMTHRDIERLAITIASLEELKGHDSFYILGEVISPILDDIEDTDKYLHSLLIQGDLYTSDPYLYRIWARKIPKSVIIGFLRKGLNYALNRVREKGNGRPLAFRMKGIMRFVGLSPEDKAQYKRAWQALDDHKIQLKSSRLGAKIVIYPDTTFSMPASEYYAYISEELSKSIRDHGVVYSRSEIISLVDYYENRTSLGFRPLFIARDILDNPVGFIESWEGFGKPDFYVLTQDSKEAMKLKELKKIGLFPKWANVISVSDAEKIEDRSLILLSFKESIPDYFTAVWDSLIFNPLEENELLDWRRPFEWFIERVFIAQESKKWTYQRPADDFIHVGVKVLKGLRNRYENFRRVLENI